MDAQATAAFLQLNGELIEIRRMSGRGIFLPVQCRARVTDYLPNEMQGGIVQGDRRIIISNAEIAAALWPGPVRAGDVVVLLEQNNAAASVISAFPNRLNGETWRHTLQVRGT